MTEIIVPLIKPATGQVAEDQILALPDGTLLQTLRHAANYIITQPTT